MRSIHLLAIAALVAAAPTTAQQRGKFSIFPDDGLDSASFIDRGSIPPTAAGELLAEMPLGMIAGVGQIGGDTCTLIGLEVVLQDENAATIETFGVVARPRDPSGSGPDMTTTIYQGGGLQTPQATGRAAWTFTITFQNPQAVPCAGDWFQGYSMPAAPNWPTSDGLSMVMADYSGGTLGDHPRANAPGLGWSVDATTNLPIAHQQVWAAGLLASGPTLQVGAVDPSNTRTAAAANQGSTTFGAGGLYPDVSGAPRADGLEVRIYDAGAPGGVTGILLAFGVSPVPLPIAGVTGELRLDPATMLAFAGAPIATAPPERVILPFLPPASIPASLSGATVHFQGIVLDPTLGLWATNRWGVNF